MDLDLDQILSKLNQVFFDEGYFWGRRLIPHIKNTKYESLENGILSKKQLIEDLKENFKWDESHKDVAEAMGVIKAWEDAISQQPKLKFSIPSLSSEDVINTASEIGKSLNPEQVSEILSKYPEAQKNDPKGSWVLVIENLIHEII